MDWLVQNMKSAKQQQMAGRALLAAFAVLLGLITLAMASAQDRLDECVDCIVSLRLMAGWWHTTGAARCHSNACIAVRVKCCLVLLQAVISCCHMYV